nr:hypothetical protein CFP56_03285 [Quercus suber]
MPRLRVGRRTKTLFDRPPTLDFSCEHRLWPPRSACLHPGLQEECMRWSTEEPLRAGAGRGGVCQQSKLCPTSSTSSCGGSSQPVSTTFASLETGCVACLVLMRGLWRWRQACLQASRAGIGLHD